VPWPCGFDLYPDNPSVNEALAIDASSQASTIKAAALKALKKAFDNYPSTVLDVNEGTANTGDHSATVVDGYSFDGTRSMNRCGLTTPSYAANDSNIYYQANMEQAQWALPIVLNTAQDVQNALGRADLMKAIGTGIGNNAAHEIAHQFLLELYGMDDNSKNTYNGQGCNGATASWTYGIGSIQWESVTANALKNALGAGWHK
jgi:hypothetical protein